MPFAAIEIYIKQLEARKAELRLMMADVELLPHMKKTDREKTLNGWMKILKMSQMVEAKPASPGRLKLMGIGVRRVNKDVTNGNQ